MQHPGPDREPTADDFQALARSSPWRFRTLHFTHRSANSRGGDGEPAEAWLDRPAHRVTVRAGDIVDVGEGAPYGTSPGRRDAPFDAPRFRVDGMVLSRPSGWHLVYGDPIWRDYRWTAMLDPEELGDGVRVDEVTTTIRHGRETWSATCRPVTGAGEDWVGGYDPRCGCCPLLDSLPSRILEYGPDHPLTQNATDLPTTYRVHLDLQTGVVVRVEALDGFAGAVLSNEIHDVDTPLAPPRP